MSTQTSTNSAPLRCRNCGNEDGPFEPRTGLCETCADQNRGQQ